MASSLPKYRVKSLDRSNNVVDAFLEEALEIDMPSMSQKGWRCNWQEFWKNTDFACEAIIKLHYQERLLGLIRFGLYPYPCDNKPEFVYISNIETNQRERLISPVGFWLIWYAVNVGLKICTGDVNQSLVLLDSVESAFSYYQEKVKMEYIRPITIAPGEDGYAFRFSIERATNYRNRIQQQYGIPELLR